MPLFNPKSTSKTEPEKRFSVTVKFSVWNELMATGEPSTVLENILNGWYMERLQAKPAYVVDTNKRISKIDFGAVSTQENLILMREKLARETALGRHRIAESTRLKIIEMERDLLLNERNSVLDTNSSGNSTGSQDLSPKK